MEIKKFQDEKLVIGIIFNPTFVNHQNLIESLTKAFGEVDYKSKILSFKHTNYYCKEMGDDLKKSFVSFKKLISPDYLSEVKIITNKIEKKFINTANNRKVNLDPGILSLAKLILASTKNFSHRIPLQKGIYGEVTIYYKNKNWNTFPYTFPDFQTPEYFKIFNEIREIYKKQIENI